MKLRHPRLRAPNRQRGSQSADEVPGIADGAHGIADHHDEVYGIADEVQGIADEVHGIADDEWHSNNIDEPVDGAQPHNGEDHSLGEEDRHIDAHEDSDLAKASVAILTPTTKLGVHVISMIATAIKNEPIQTMRDLDHALNIAAALGAVIQASREAARPVHEDIGDDK